MLTLSLKHFFFQMVPLCVKSVKRKRKRVDHSNIILALPAIYPFPQKKTVAGAAGKKRAATKKNTTGGEPSSKYPLHNNHSKKKKKKIKCAIMHLCGPLFQ